MASVDMFDKTFKIADMKVDRQDQVAEGAGQLSIRLHHPSERRGQDHRWGVRGRDEKSRTPRSCSQPITERWEQPTWELTMRMMPGRRLQVGVPATGLALYRRTGAQLAVWVTADISNRGIDRAPVGRPSPSAGKEPVTGKRIVSCEWRDEKHPGGVRRQQLEVRGGTGAKATEIRPAEPSV